MKKTWIILVALGLMILGSSCTYDTTSRQDFTGSWYVLLRFDAGGSQSRTFKLTGYNNSGQVVFRGENVGTWSAVVGRIMITATYFENGTIYSEIYYGDIQTKDSISGTFDQTISIEFKDRTYSGRFTADRI